MDEPAARGVAPGAIAARLEPVVAGTQRSAVDEVGDPTALPLIGVGELDSVPPATGPETSTRRVENGLHERRLAPRTGEDPSAATEVDDHAVRVHHDAAHPADQGGGHGLRRIERHAMVVMQKRSRAEPAS